MLLGELTKGDRQKIMTICTIDVHSRDVVLKLIQAKLESASAFQWQSQLRHRWDDDENDCFANICDAQFTYCYEYLGNTPRLVITPLTDRCYITVNNREKSKFSEIYRINDTMTLLYIIANTVTAPGDGWGSCWYVFSKKLVNCKLQNVEYSSNSFFLQKDLLVPVKRLYLPV